MRFRIQIGNKYKILNMDSLMVGINSGLPYKQQYIFIDLDNKTEEEAAALAQSLLVNENLRRVLLVKTRSTDNGWHILSFSPKPYIYIINLLGKYTDGGHFAKTQDNGYSTLRVTPKNGFKPALYKIYNNQVVGVQLNFYDFDMEKVYLKLIGCEVGALKST